MTPATLVKDVTYRQPYWVLPDRRITMACAAAAGVLFIALLTAILTPDPCSPSNWWATRWRSMPRSCACSTVCLSGPDRGKDYRLHAEKNFLGRATHMDVVIESDATVSREKHGVVVFDPKKKSFWVLPGDASGLVYLNGEMVNAPAVMKADDVLELGQTKLVLVPFCGDRYNWSES